MNLISLIPNTTQLNNLTALEPINYDNLDLLLNSSLLKEKDSFNDYSNELQHLQKYKKNYNYKKNLVRVKYVRSIKSPTYGRVNPEKSLGLHSLRREIRGTLCRDYLVDIDLVNAHPNIAYQISKKINMKCPNLRKYVKERETVLDLVKSTYNINNKEAKNLIITLLNLGSYPKWLSNNNFDQKLPFLLDLSTEINFLSKEIIKNNPDLHKITKRDCSTVALYYQTIENSILEEVYLYCKKHKIIDKVFVLSNDGIMIPKEKFTVSLLKDFKNLILNKFDLKLDFKNKDIDSYYTKEQLMKAQYKTELIDKYFEQLDASSHKYFANRFYELYEDNQNYIYSTDNGWYEYDENNILMNLGKGTPLNLNSEISNVLEEDLKQNYKKMVEMVNPMDDKFKNYSRIYKSNFKNVGSATYKEGILKELLIKFNDPFIHKKIDKNDNITVFSNKLFDFTLNKFRSIEKSDYAVSYIDYEAPETKNETIRSELRAILIDIFDTDEVVNYFLDTIGFSLFTNEFEKFYLWTGSGGNGKGMLMNLISSALKTYFMIPSSDFLTSSIKSETNSNLSKCEFKKIVMVSEPRGDGKGDIAFNLEFIKSITGRDEITCRDLYKSNKTYTPKFTLYAQCNHMPSLDTVDNAIKRRFQVLHFPFQFVAEPKAQNEKLRDNSIKGKLEKLEYYSEFMGLLLDHIRDKFNERKLILPSTVQQSTTEYMSENNSVADFIAAELEVTNKSTDRIKMTDMFARYCDGDYMKLTRSKFKYNMATEGHKLHRFTQGHMYTGFQFKLEEEDEINENGALLDFQ